MSEKPKITSSEVGTLWATYREKTFILRVLEHLIPNADNEKAKQIMTDLHQNLSTYVEKIKTLFENEGAAIPIGFSSQDVNINAPKLFENGFDILFLRTIKEVSMALYTLNMGKSYREDVVNIYKDLTTITQSCYNECTQYLLERAILTRPPFVPMPIAGEYINDLHYLNGFNLMGGTRQMNTIEFSSIFHAIETNKIGMIIMSAFSQVAQDTEVQQYFHKGMEISKKIVEEFSKILLEDDISPTLSSGGNATNSKNSPFSDKLMLYCNFLFCNLSIGGNAFGFAFHLRNDLKMKALLSAKDVVDYADEGTKLMVKKGWMEKPPGLILK